MTAHFQHVVDTADDKFVAVFIASYGIAHEVLRQVRAIAGHGLGMAMTEPLTVTA
eukprot:CAMPEP_0194188518 /NCGR_PEP_ID=MMETSP0154-20130528/55382_1 /TAXON_ID=1049557 /ORGANISM="Thalassiothrix antarctica, Strain L6-D1" /LENGTH=54 /DNA_ID=CAMNT_0038909013 /DNA_START=105 /DNA_END=269 /DNA_ORIENTATION=-